MAFRAGHECLAPPFRHEPCPSGLPRSGLPEIGELADLVNCHVTRPPADLAFSPEQPQRQLLAGIGNPFRDAVSYDRFSCRFSGIPPNRATSGFLPSLSTVTCRHVLRPCGVSILALYLAAIFRPVEWYLHASVLSSEVPDLR